jgi:hypothetical protein
MLDPDAFPHLVEKLLGLFGESVHPRKFRRTKQCAKRGSTVKAMFTGISQKPTVVSVDLDRVRGYLGVYLILVRQRNWPQWFTQQ